MKQVTESQCTSKNTVQIYSHWNMLIGTSKIIWCWCKVIIYADTNSQISALTPIRYHIICSRSALLPTIENALWRHRCITGREGLPSLIALLCIIVLWQSSKPNKEYFVHMDLHVTYSLLVVERLNDCYIPIIDLVGMIVRFLRLETKPYCNPLYNNYALQWAWSNQNQQNCKHIAKTVG